MYAEFISFTFCGKLLGRSWEEITIWDGVSTLRVTLSTAAPGMMFSWTPPTALMDEVILRFLSKIVARLGAVEAYQGLT